jgi:glycosyltransferase involved in cell wall biosynthesis
MQLPAIAVIMPVHNRANVVRRAIDSVLAQSFTDFELMVVDDGSKDGTADIVAQIEDPRVRLIRVAVNGGSNAARNRGIAGSTAALLAFLDSDDVYLPGKLGWVVDLFARRPDIDVLVDSFTKEFPSAPDRSPAMRINPVIDGSDEFLTALFARRLWKATPAISVRRDAAERAGQFDPALRRRQDFDFLVRLAAVARCASTDQILWTKFESEEAISAKPETFLDATIELCRRYPQYLSNPAYRVGLSRDVARHFGRLWSKRRFGVARRDAFRFAGEFGFRPLVVLIREGRREMNRRRAAGRG